MGQVKQPEHENDRSERDPYFVIRNRPSEPRQEAIPALPTGWLSACCNFQTCPHNPSFLWSVPLPPAPATYLWKRWPQGSLRADCMESQQMAQSSLLTASSSGVATANLRRKRKRQKSWLPHLSTASCVENPALRKPYFPLDEVCQNIYLFHNQNSCCKGSFSYTALPCLLTFLAHLWLCPKFK